MEKSKKFFNEAGGGHYDIRFFRGKVETTLCQQILLDLLDVFSSVCDTVDVKPILMHGALIGWYWNKRLLPWDDDIDVCVEYGDLLKLEKSLRTGNALFDEKKFLFEVNPNHTDRTTLNRNHHDWIEPNKIDARFIDKQTGLFLDITALSTMDDERLSTKCPHIYLIANIFPLQRSVFEEQNVYLPANVPKVLIQEYGPDVLSNKIFAGYFFNNDASIWQRIGEPIY